MAWVGCCGFVKGRDAYFRSFQVVEVQQTFYQPPKVERVRRWRQEAPPGFRFCIKAWQTITHPAASPTYRRSGLKIPDDERESYGFFRPTAQVRQGWAATEELALALKADAILFQCPPSFVPTPENLESMRRFFRDISRSDWVLAWEPRGRWPRELVGSLCSELGLVHCVDPFEAEPVTEGPAYLRVHGGRGYRGTFTDAQLEALARRQRGKEGYILFNNLSMFEDALRLKRIFERLEQD